jgi:hypothetical protein
VLSSLYDAVVTSEIVKVINFLSTILFVDRYAAVFTGNQLYLV